MQPRGHPFARPAVSAFTRILLVVSVSLLAACQLPSLHEPKSSKKAAKKSSIFGGSVEVDSEWEPALPGRDLARDEALAYAVREVLLGLSPEQRLPVIASLVPGPPLIHRM